MNTITNSPKAIAALEQDDLCHVRICLGMLVAAAPMYWMDPDNADVVAMMYDEAKQEGLIDKGYYGAHQTQPKAAAAGKTTERNHGSNWQDHRPAAGSCRISQNFSGSKRGVLG